MCGPFTVCPLPFSTWNDTVSASVKWMRNAVLSDLPSWFGLNVGGATDVIAGWSDTTVKFTSGELGPKQSGPTTGHAVTDAVCAPSASGVVTATEYGAVSARPTDVWST